MKYLLALVFVAATCTPPVPAVPGVPATPEAGAADASMDAAIDAAQADAPYGTPCVRACARLAILGCPEMGPACVETCDHVMSSHLTPFDAECVAHAVSAAAVAQCPAIRCSP